MVNDSQCAVHHISRRTVINVQKDLLRFFIIFPKIQHYPRFCAAEAVDRLIVIYHHEQIILRRRQHTHHVILRLVHVLELIHQNIAELFLPLFQNIRPLEEQLPAI